MEKIIHLKSEDILQEHDDVLGPFGWFEIPNDFVGKKVKDCPNNYRRIIEIGE